MDHFNSSLDFGGGFWFGFGVGFFDKEHYFLRTVSSAISSYESVVGSVIAAVCAVKFCYCVCAESSQSLLQGQS